MNILKNKLFVGSICLLVAAALAFVLLPKLYDSKADTSQVITLAKTVDYGSVITDDMLTVSEVGSYGLPGDVITDKADVVGLVANSNVFAGEYLWRNRFITPEAYAEIEAKNGGLEAGEYLLTISCPTASTGIAGVLRANDIVDVYDCSKDENDNISVSKALDSVTVYKVLNSKLLSLDELDAELEKNKDADINNYDFLPAYVVFIVNEEQAKTLIRLEKTKSLHLTLREAGA